MCIFTTPPLSSGLTSLNTDDVEPDSDDENKNKEEEEEGEGGREEGGEGGELGKSHNI